MFNFLLGVAESKPVTKEGLLEFENSVYGQMKDENLPKKRMTSSFFFYSIMFLLFLKLEASYSPSTH
ncbi:hypothetical protein COE55_14055 [Priestia megaterium]|uniref:hypothetical protein n=1 Tax=Priestia megaterium TaxID=1404 RepID=UPI000BFC8A2F|nr:hypothetical protein [Priestia megaterium]PGZ78364.1 hypothetical protein COE55_14055 [Priestia megaterium]